MSDAAGTEAIIDRALTTSRTIAIVGASADAARPSHDVMQYLQTAGYDVIPVNPGLAGQNLLGVPVVATLRDVAKPIDLVDIFRRVDAVPAIVEDAIAVGAKTVWMQLDIVDEASAERARAAGLDVVMDRCTKIEHARLMRRRP